MRQFLIEKLRGSWIEPLAIETDEQLWKLKGKLRGSYSQHGEDRVILEFFGGHPGTYVDVGANYPVKISNTYLLYRHGWTGLIVEPIPRLVKRHKRFRPRDKQVNAGVGTTPSTMKFFEFRNTGLSTFDEQRSKQTVDAGIPLHAIYDIEIMPLSSLIDRMLPSQNIDLLSVDTEGFDEIVLSSVDWSRHRPRLVIFEQEEDDPSAGVRKLMESKGYTLWRRVGCNVLMQRTGD